VKKGVLTVRDNEHNVADTVGGNKVAYQTLPSLGHIHQLPGPTFPRDGGTTNPIYFNL
jgi:hypothetical protein